MAYRDDRDALHARNEALEAEVAALREQQREHAEQLESAQRGIRVEVAPAHARSRVNPAALAALVGASTVAFALVMTVRAARHDRVLAAAAGPTGTALAVWDATVKSSNDASVVVGTTCTIESSLVFAGQGMATTATSAHTTLRCSGATLYDGTDIDDSSPAFVVTRRPVTEDELPLPNYENLEQVFDFVLSGASTTPQLTLDTVDGLGLVHDSQRRIELQVTPGSRPQSILRTHRR